MLQPSVAVAVPRALLISAPLGLHPSDVVVPPVVITGGVGSFMNVTLRAEVAVLPQASLAVNVLVAVREQPLLIILPSLEVIVGTLQASVAVAPGMLPNTSAPVIQPKLIASVELVNTGGVLSEVHVTVRDIVAVLPQPSRAVNVLV